MKIKITILFLFISGILWSQPNGLYKKALDRWRDQKYEAAVRIGKRCYQKETDRRADVLDLMGHINFRIGNKKEAEKNYKQLLANYKEADGYLLYQANTKLADINIERKEYKTALNYLRNSEPYKYSWGCGTGKYEEAYTISYKYAVCFDGLNQVDSAINKLNRFMFQPCPLMTFQSQHVIRNQFYYQLLLKKHTACEIEEEAERAVANIYYSKKYDPAISGNDLKMKRIQCSLSFFGIIISIEDLGYSGPEDFYPYSKEGILERVRGSELWRLIHGVDY